MLSLTDDEIESHNAQTFCYICKKKFHDVDDRKNDSDDDEFDSKKLYGDAAELNDVDEEYYDHHHHDGSDDIDDGFDATKFHGNASEIDDVDDDYYDCDYNSDDEEFGFRNLTFHGDIEDVYDYDDEEFGRRFHGVSQNHERVCKHCHHTGKYRTVAHSICNLRYKTPREILLFFNNCSNYVYYLIHNLLGANRKSRKYENHKIQNKIH